VTADFHAAGAALDLTVILCVHNGADTITAQLEALAGQEWEGSWEVLVVDNRSTDATPEVVASHVSRHDRFRVVKAADHAGLSYARNVGVERARGRAVAFCDDDDVVGDGWVAAMGRALAEHPVVGSHMVYDTLSDGAALDGRTEFQSRRIEKLFGCPIVNGASGWRREVWLALGGNDERMRTTGEDFDMALRSYLELGLEPVLAADAVYHCRRRSGLRPTFRQARRYGRAHVELYRRHGRGRVDARLELKRALARWWWLLRTLPALVRPERRTLWAWHAGMRVGRLEGSIRMRTLWP
jgi:glycosyltransferase involved in cell wall biosynthesis